MLLPIPVRTWIVECPEGTWGVDIIGYENMIVPFGGIWFFFAFYAGGNGAFMYPADYLWKIPYLLIVSYLLSCTVFYIFKKISQKRK